MSQATFADIDDTEPEQSTDVPRELADPAPVQEGDLVTLDRMHLDDDRAYEVTDARSNSLVVERDDNKVTLRKRRGEFYHGSTAFTHDVYLIETDDHPILECDACGQPTDPADFARRVDHRYICRGCDE